MVVITVTTVSMPDPSLTFVESDVSHTSTMWSAVHRGEMHADARRGNDATVGLGIGDNYVT